MHDTPQEQTYRKTNAEYAEQFGKSVRQIQRWKAAGFPLDDPEQTRLLLEAGILPQTPRPALPPVFEFGGLESAPVESSGALGISAAIERARFIERQVYESFQLAEREGDDVAASARQKRWVAAADALRKLEESNPSILRENADVVPLGELQVALAELFQRHRTDLDNLGKRICAELVGKDEIAIREAIDGETAKLVQALHSCRYLEGAGDER